jgi:hypothetical protein
MWSYWNYKHLNMLIFKQGIMSLQQIPQVKRVLAFLCVRSNLNPQIYDKIIQVTIKLWLYAKCVLNLWSVLFLDSLHYPTIWTDTLLTLLFLVYLMTTLVPQTIHDWLTDWMILNNELERIWKEVLWSNWRLSWHLPVWTGQNHEKPQNSRCPDKRF